MTILVIVESISKCKKIESYLGKGYKCCASFGHIRKFSNGLKSINKNKNYLPSYVLQPEKSKYVKNLRINIKKSNEVILATDDDREGEAIAWHICKVFNLSVEKTKRIVFHEITKSAIVNAVNNYRYIDMDKVNSQQARAVLDILVGYTISPYLWKHISRNSNGGLSAGRCQTPALRLIYDNQQDINKSPGKKIYESEGLFMEKDILFKLNYNHKSQDEVCKFLEETVNTEHIYNVTKPKINIKLQPSPFTTSTLQQKSSNELHYSPKQTMRIAQTLYEAGLITYHRTDSKTYSKEFIDKTKKFIKKKWNNSYVNDNIDNLITSNKKSKKTDNNAQEAHEAIRPTDINKSYITTSDKITNKEIRLYKLIWKNTLASCMSPAKFNSITAVINGANKKLWKHTEEQCIFEGWKIVNGENLCTTNKLYQYLISYKINTIVNYKKINSKLVLKDIKNHYTEAKLVQLLEKKGIGRPSTFSSIIDKIQNRKWVLKQDVKGKKIQCIDYQLINDEITEIDNERVFGNERNKLVIQQLGVIVIEFLIEHYDVLFNYDYTKNMENELDKIANGNKIWYTLCKDCDDKMISLSKNLKNESRKTYHIDKNHQYMIGKYGPVIKYEDDKGNTSWKSVKKNIDMNKLKNGDYTLEDILDNKPKISGKLLGIYKDNDVILKKGKFGLYINHNNKNTSLKFLKKDYDEITLNDVISIFEKSKNNSNIIKTINDELSIRKGKYGPYIMYKTKKMKRPKFKSIGDNTPDEFLADKGSISEIILWINE